MDEPVLFQNQLAQGQDLLVGTRAVSRYGIKPNINRWTIWGSLPQAWIGAVCDFSTEATGVPDNHCICYVVHTHINGVGVCNAAVLSSSIYGGYHMLPPS